MTMLRHLVRADVRQFRWALLLWSVLVVGETLVTATRPSLGANAWQYGNAGMVLGLLWWALQIAMLLLVPMIVQAHAAVGTDAFWMTRPMRPQSVFASKVTLLGVTTVLLFCAVRLVLMLWVGVPAREALFVTIDTAITNTAWLALLMAGAAVTLNLPRFALLCGAVVVLLALTVTLLIMQAQRSDADEGAYATLMLASEQPTLPPADDPTRDVVFLLSVAAAGFALAALQYRTRRRLVSVPAAAGGLVLAALALPYWPIPLLRVQSALPGWTDRPEALQLRAPSPAIELTQEGGFFGAGTGSVPLSLSGIEPGWLPRLELLGASVALDDGTTIVSRKGFQSGVGIEGSAEPPWRIVARHVLSVEQVFGPPASRSEQTVVIAAKQVHPAAELHGHYRGEFAVRLEHWEVVAARPVREGSVFQDGSYQFAVERISVGPGIALSVLGRERRASSSLDRKPRITYNFFVRNAQRSRAMEGYESEPFGSMHADFGGFGLPFSFSNAGGSRFFLRSATVAFPPPYGPQDQKLDWDPAWYADAELVLVRVTEQGAVKRTLDIPGATLAVKR